LTEKKLRKRVQFWAEKMLPELGLSSWDFDVKIVDDPEPRYEGSAAVANVSCSTHYDTAWMEFDREWVSNVDERNLDKTIIHELLHVILRDWKNVQELPEQMMPPGEYKQWEMLLNHEEEGVVERLARSIAQLYHTLSAE
jgi:hypothetical protein